VDREALIFPTFSSKLKWAGQSASASRRRVIGRWNRRVEGNGRAMVKVLTIRDPKTGALIAEEPVQPREDEDSALARIYRKSLGPDAPEFMVMSPSVWLDDRDWAAELARDWGGRFGLVVLGPKEDPKLEKSKLVLASLSESMPKARAEFPMVKEEIDKIRRRRRHDAVVPVKPDDPLRAGDTVKFYQAGHNPFGEVLRVPDGESISVVIKEIRAQGEWVGHHLYYIAWDSESVAELPKGADRHRSK
jgi:hypothetical protein